MKANQPKRFLKSLPGITSALIIFLSLCQCSVETENTIFYVSPHGNDSWSGTLEAANDDNTDGPFRTLTKARDAVREKIPNAQSDIIVFLRGGEYFIDETVVFGLEDSGNSKCKIRFKNYPNEKPVISSGYKITNWKKLHENLAGLPQAAKDKIYVAELPENFKPFYSLFEGSEALPRARGEGMRLPAVPEDWGYPAKSSFIFEEGTFKNWKNIEDVDIVIRPTYKWVMNILPLKSIDEKNRVAYTSVPGTYPLRQLKWTRRDVNVWIENTLSSLDQPGEWVYNSNTRKLYLWTQGNGPGNNITIPRLVELLRVEGEIDDKEKEDKVVRHIVFEGLTFTCADYFRRTSDLVGKGVQHDWEYFDEATAMVRFRGADNCAIKNCIFTNSSSTAIRLDLYCQNNTISGNTINSIGGTGILLAGYGPGTKDVNKNNKVTNNHIFDVGQVYWHSPAIFAWQSGSNLIANNLIHHTPYTGIVVSGRIVWDRSGKAECSKTIRWDEVGTTTGSSPWEEREPFLHARNNIVEKNEIHHVMEYMGDGNGIYISGAGKGNIVRENYVHDCPSEHLAEGIRCDDDQHMTSIESNIVVRMGGMATGICSKGRNDIINNIIAMPLTVPSRGLIALEGTPIDGSIIERNILFTDKPDAPIYYLRLTSSAGDNPRLEDCKVDKNIYYCTTNKDWAKSHLKKYRQYGIEQQSEATDPMFIDFENNKFSLDENSPAIKLGFKQINTRQIGLLTQ